MFKKAAICLALLCLCAGCTAAEPNTEEAPARAGYSGSVTLFSSMQEEQIQAIKEGFEAKYPDITMEYFFAGTNKVLTKLATEIQSGKITADLVWTGSPSDYQKLRDDRVLSPYISPQAININEAFMDEHHYYIGGRLMSMVIAYNTDLVSEEEAPRTWKDQQPQGTGDQALQQRLGCHARNDGQAKNRQPEILGRAELHGQLCQQWGEEIQRDTREQAAAEGGETGNGQGFARLTLQGELIAFNGGGSGSRRTRRVDQNGGNGTAEDGAAVDAAQYDQSRLRSHGKGHGQQQSHAHSGRQAGQTPDNDADGCAPGHKQQVNGRQRVEKSLSHQG